MFLGIDSGGTKTALVLVRPDGSIAARAQAPSCYYLGSTEGPALVERVLRDAVVEVCGRAGVTAAQISFAFVALPAYGEVSRDLAALDRAPRAALGHDRYACGNDMVAGWAGSLGGVDGINVVSGTGSICYGERGGRHVRTGGWGELFGDEGSGHWIAVRGLQVFSRMSDGRQPAGPLLGRVRERLGLESDLDALDVTLGQWHGDRRRVAALSTVVAAAAADGDEAAAAILTGAAAELVALVDTARRRLGFAADEPVPVSYSGGVFASPSVREEFVRLLLRADAEYDVRLPLYPPDIGSALYAARLAGTPLDPPALWRLRDG
ncbi:MAG: N-acetylglucosamine kinase [Cellulomonas sp. 73-145]|uniref:N-acetylglucosamine kinase n=1 Tax=Cellulomonas sp. 73-145 TaxID=1895739 RepID=UPI00092848BE|nr:BadF/BadG/BcrA/BcrD ATPase family protein [Cellulomonas sp. 73-145]OJV60850.1 MAG: N-acetylglucosamine kinase [Cellulomonas sp. 73-145]